MIPGSNPSCQLTGITAWTISPATWRMYWDWPGNRPAILLGHSIRGMITLPFCRLSPIFRGQSKHTGSLAGGRILFLAAVPVDAAKKTATNADDEDALRQEAEHLAADLLPIAMTCHPREEGEDVMQVSCHAVPEPSEDLREHTADAEKDGVRLWLLGAKVE
jgi:hypothetical protein